MGDSRAFDRSGVGRGVGRPCVAPSECDLPEPLTIFLTAGERAEALRRLKRLHARRDVALRRALGMRVEGSRR